MPSNNAPPILSAPIPPLYIRMALPIIFGLLINGLFNFVDAVFISRAVGTYAIGGVSAAFPIQMIMISISAMLGSGMASIISRLLGANKDQHASFVFNASLLFSALVGLSLSFIIIFFKHEIFSLLQLPKSLSVYAVEYITPIAAIGLISFCHGTMSECLRAQGKNTDVFKLMAGMAVLNIILDAIFLFVFDWGVPGAAWATAISITTAFFFAIYLLKSGEHRISFNLQQFKLKKEVHQETMILGIPVLLSYTGFAMTLLAINLALVQIGGDNTELLISAHGILNRTFMLIFLPVLGMMIAFQTLAGFNYGALKFQRVRAVLVISLQVSTLYCLFWSFVMILEPEYLFNIFSQDQVLIQTASDISFIVFLGFITTGVGMICPALFQAIGRARPAILLNATHNYFFLLPFIALYVVFLGDTFNSSSIWWVFPLSDLLTTIIVGLYTWRYFKQMKVLSN